MMLLIARAATARESVGSAASYGWCRFSDHAMSPPCAGVIGSSPFLPFDESVNAGLSPLVSSEKTHKICLVAFAQAKLTWLGSDATFGFWQATEISACTVATLAGHAALPPGRTKAATITASTMAPPVTAIARQCAAQRLNPDRRTFRRPRLISTSVRSSGPPTPASG